MNEESSGKLSYHSLGLGTWGPDEEERASGAFDWGIFFALLDALYGAATKGAEDDDSSAMAGKFEELLKILSFCFPLEMDSWENLSSWFAVWFFLR